MKLFLLAGLLSPTLFAQSLTGLWDATVVSGGVTVPFRMEFKSEGAPGQAQTVQAWFFNGEDRFVSNSGRFENGKLSVHFDHIAAVLDATYKGGVLDGMYAGNGRTGKLPFHAEPAKPQPAASANAPNIDGEWEIQQVKSGKGESAWRFLVRQNGSDLSATVLRVDGGIP